MDWYEEDVKYAVAERQSCPYDPKTIFYGSSSIRLWSHLYIDFENFKPVNLGFGGSTLAACAWFFNKTVAPIKSPDILLLYAGDNDLGDGRHAEEVLLFYREFTNIFRAVYPEIPFYYISIKPSISRLEILPEIQRTNALIEAEINNSKRQDYYINVYDKMLNINNQPIVSFFESDGLHLSRQGYLLWREIILNDCLLQQKK